MTTHTKRRTGWALAGVVLLGFIALAFSDGNPYEPTGIFTFYTTLTAGLTSAGLLGSADGKNTYQ